MRGFVCGSLLFLAACCPPALGPTPTAFRAEVLGATLPAALLQLQRDPASPILSAQVKGATLAAEDGRPLTLSAFEPGDSVYVTGVMSSSGLVAREVRRLE